MTDRFSRLGISDVIIPQDIIVDVSEKRISAISEAFGTDNEMLFFIIVTAKDGKYHLVDRYDVYVAAKKRNRKNLRAFVLSDSDDVTAHLILSMKYFPNPATVIRMITPYVEHHGLEKTLCMFYLDPGFGKMYDVHLDSEILCEFESLIQYACSVGVRSVVPVQLFEEISRYDSAKDQKMLIRNMRILVETQKGKFRWPHREFLRKLSGESEQKPVQRKEKKATTDVREFSCCNCKASHIVTPNYIGPKKEIDGVILISGDDDSEPVYHIPTKYQKHLGVSKESPPIILSSKDMDWKTLKEKLSGKNFIVFVGENTR